MRRKALILILFTFLKSALAFPCPALHPDTIDSRLFLYAKNTPADITQDIDKLVNYLKQPSAGKKNIVKTFSYWIMQNISYDISGFLNDVYNTEGIKGTLRNKKGVCQDYSELFKAMCDRAGIRCYVITGYAKSFNYKPGDRFTRSNHSWNVVCLDSTYMLMDLTWSSGCLRYVDDQWRYFINPDISQIFTAPEAFVENHLPSDPQWQLLTHPVSMNAFMKFDTYRDMQRDPSGYFNFADSIRSFEKLDKEAQDLKLADNAFRFYPVMLDYAYHYYNQAVNCSNEAIDQYNAAVTSYNKSITDTGTPIASGDYNRTMVSSAINNFNKAVRLLSKISSFSDNQISAPNLLERCHMGLDATNELMKLLK